MAPQHESDEVGSAEAAARIEAMADLTGGFAHDFNNLLTVIRGSAELLASTASGLPADARGHLASILDSADRAAELTARLLAFARRQPLQPQAVEIAPLLAQIRDELAARNGAGTTVRVLVPRGIDAALVDPLQFAAVLRAAAENAREAMPEGGVLTLAASNHDGGGKRELKVLVSDSGTGMAPDVLARAFEPFFTTKPVGAGPGLGLSHIHGFAAQSGGRVELDSRPGRGTTLVLTLPAVEPEAAAQPARAPARGTRVLLVEDSDTVAAFAETLLGDMGLVVTRAANAEEALAVLDADVPVDIMFSDIVMPGMSGLELAARVHADRPKLPIVLATGYSEAAARNGSQFPILPKPYRRDALAAMMGSALAA